VTDVLPDDRDLPPPDASDTDLAYLLRTLLKREPTPGEIAVLRRACDDERMRRRRLRMSWAAADAQAAAEARHRGRESPPPRRRRVPPPAAGLVRDLLTSPEAMLALSLLWSAVDIMRRVARWADELAAAVVMERERYGPPLPPPYTSRPGTYARIVRTYIDAKLAPCGRPPHPTPWSDPALAIPPAALAWLHAAHPSMLYGERNVWAAVARSGDSGRARRALQSLVQRGEPVLLVHPYLGQPEPGPPRGLLPLPDAVASRVVV
jgi:hypothetical protein